MRVSGPPVGRARCSRPRRAVAERELFEQRLGEAVVVVAGDEDDARARHRFAELLEERVGRASRTRARGKVAQLEHVAEQDEAVGGGDLLEQDAADRRVAGDVLAGGGAEVQVGNDRGAHPGQRNGAALCLARAAANARGSAWLLSQSLARMPGWLSSAKSGWRPCNGIELAYQEVGDPDGEPLMLVMGLATQMIAWDEELCVDAGRTRLPRRSLRQPRHRPLDQARLGRRAGAAPTSSSAAAAPRRICSPTWPRTRSALMDHLGIDSAHVVGDLDGRDDRPDLAIEHPRADPLAGLDALDHRQPLGGARRPSRSSD